MFLPAASDVTITGWRGSITGGGRGNTPRILERATATESTSAAATRSPNTESTNRVRRPVLDPPSFWRIASRAYPAATVAAKMHGIRNRLGQCMLPKTGSRWISVQGANQQKLPPAATKQSAAVTSHGQDVRQARTTDSAASPTARGPM